jgi:hypothetical protein
MSTSNRRAGGCRDPSARPRLRQRRQQVDLAGVALRQHLDDAGGGAEVAVDLERRVGVEQLA